MIRRATVDDLWAIAGFQTVCWREAYRGLVPQDYLDRVTVADRKHRWRHRMLSGDREIALAINGTVIDGVVSWGCPDGALELMSLYVRAACRRTGLGSALVDYAIGRRAARLWVFEGNPRARMFYDRLGFVHDGARMIDPDTGLGEVRYVRLGDTD